MKGIYQEISISSCDFFRIEFELFLYKSRNVAFDKLSQASALAWISCIINSDKRFFLKFCPAQEKKVIGSHQNVIIQLKEGKVAGKNLR